MYVYYTVVLVDTRRPFKYLPWKPQLVVSVIYHLCIRETECCVLVFPAIWWRSVELQRGNVAFGSVGLTLLNYSIILCQE